MRDFSSSFVKKKRNYTVFISITRHILASTGILSKHEKCHGFIQFCGKYAIFPAILKYNNSLSVHYLNLNIPRPANMRNFKRSWTNIENYTLFTTISRQKRGVQGKLCALVSKWNFSSEEIRWLFWMYNVFTWHGS